MEREREHGKTEKASWVPLTALFSPLFVYFPLLFKQGLQGRPGGSVVKVGGLSC